MPVLCVLLKKIANLLNRTNLSKSARALTIIGQVHVEEKSLMRYGIKLICLRFVAVEPDLIVSKAEVVLHLQNSGLASKTIPAEMCMEYLSNSEQITQI